VLVHGATRALLVAAATVRISSCEKLSVVLARVTCALAKLLRTGGHDLLFRLRHPERYLETRRRTRRVRRGAEHRIRRLDGGGHRSFDSDRSDRQLGGHVDELVGAPDAIDGEGGAIANASPAPKKGCRAEAEAQLGRPLAKLELVAAGVELM
jgi:hypothetical protein